MYTTPYLLQNYAPIPESGCWIWLGHWTPWGYGCVNRRGKWITGAHQMFYRLNKGEIPPGMMVCHKCDTPQCVNPDHLFLGTNSQNQKDRMAKGRTVVAGIRKKPKNAKRTCLTCGTGFMAEQSAVNRGWALYCSTTCRRKTRPTP